jgi:hypothetical protein
LVGGESGRSNPRDGRVPGESGGWVFAESGGAVRSAGGFVVGASGQAVRAVGTSGWAGRSARGLVSGAPGRVGSAVGVSGRVVRSTGGALADAQSADCFVDGSLGWTRSVGGWVGVASAGGAGGGSSDRFLDRHQDLILDRREPRFGSASGCVRSGAGALVSAGGALGYDCHAGVSVGCRGASVVDGVRSAGALGGASGRGRVDVP